MITIRPAVQKRCSRAWRIICHKRDSRMEAKRDANRRHRRFLNGVVRAFQRDPDRFLQEPFAAPSLSAWDIW